MKNKFIEEIYTLIKTNGRYTLDENVNLRRLTLQEYRVFQERVNKKIITENDYKLYYQKNKIHEGRSPGYLTLFQILKEEQTIKNPETGRDIKVSSALTYDKDSSVYKAAKKAVSHDDDSHGHESKLTRKQKLASAAADVVLKKLPGVSAVAGQSEKIMDSMKDIVDSGKEANGILNKAKAIGGTAKEKLKNWSDDKKSQFVNSLHDENTGERKKLGKIFKSKGKALSKGIVNGLKEEVKHISHQLSDGKDAAKMLARSFKEGNTKEVLKSDDFKDKVTSGIQGVATTFVVGMAAASGPAGMALKAASLSLNPGDILKQVITADVYFDLQRSGKLKLIQESLNKGASLTLIEEEVDNKIEKIDEEFLLKLLTQQAGNELENIERPLDDYEKSEMDLVIGYTEMADDIKDSVKSKKEESKFKQFFKL